MKISANEVAKTRLCRAADCPDDADTYGLFCTRHERKRRSGEAVRLHVAPEQGPATIKCKICGRKKPASMITGSRCKPCLAEAKRAKAADAQ